MKERQVPMRKNPNAVALGRKGGLARAKRLQAGEIPITGAATPVRTKCSRCDTWCDTASEARTHCRKARNVGKVGK